MHDKSKAVRRAARTMFTGCLFAALAAAGVGCGQRDNGAGDAETRHMGGRPAQPMKGPGDVGEPGKGSAPTGGDVIRDFSVLVSAPDRRTLNDRPVDFEMLDVQKVSSDKLIWLGPSSTQLPILLDDKGRAAMGTLKLERGQRVNVRGNLHVMPTVDDLKQTWGVEEEEAKSMNRWGLYLQLSSISMEQINTQPVLTAAPVAMPPVEPPKGDTPAQEPEVLKPGQKPEKITPGQQSEQPGQRMPSK